VEDRFDDNATRTTVGSGPSSAHAKDGNALVCSGALVCGEDGLKVRSLEDGDTGRKSRGWVVGASGRVRASLTHMEISAFGAASKLRVTRSNPDLM